MQLLTGSAAVAGWDPRPKTAIPRKYWPVICCGCDRRPISGPCAKKVPLPSLRALSGKMAAAGSGFFRGAAFSISAKPPFYSLRYIRIPLFFRCRICKEIPFLWPALIGKMSTKVNRLTAAAGSGPPFGPFSGRVGSTHPAQQRPAGRDLLFLGGLALCCNIIIFSFGRDRRRLCADKEISFGPAAGDLRPWVYCVHRCRAAGLVCRGPG